MDVKNRLLAFAAAIVASALVLGIAYAAFYAYRNHTAPIVDLRPANDSSDLGTAATVPPPDSGAVIGGSHAERIFAQRSEIKFLEALLEKKTELLGKKTELLEQKTDELSVARADLDEAIATLEMLAELAFTVENETVDAGAEERLRDELVKLREEREMDAAQDAAMAEQLEMLRAELERNDERILELQQSSGRTIEAINAERRSLENTATDALVQAGSSSVPGLVDAMMSPSPQIRVWAATTLGRIRADASDAIPVLVEALSDPDEEVRIAAQRALDLIDGGGTGR